MMPRSRTAWSSTRTRLAGAWIAAMVAIVGTTNVAAQSAPVLARIGSLVAARDTTQAKSVVDSVLADTDPSAAVYPEALYWRGALAGLPAGRTDLVRLIVEYPLHDRVSDALYLLAHDDLATGNRETAATRLERITRDFAASAAGPDAAVELARMRRAEGHMAAACVAYDSALAHIPDSNVERRNRVAYEARPCERLRQAEADSVAAVTAANAAAAQAAVQDSVARAVAVARSAARSAARKAAKPAGEAAGGQRRSGRSPTPPAGKWSVQVAAYASQSDAGRLASRLKGLGYDARVTGDGPFRVHVGRFARRTDATAMVTKLKDAKFTAIVVDAERP